MIISREQKIKHQGFTIVELVIAIAVIAILAIITVSSYISVKNKNMTAAGETTAQQAVLKVKGWYSTNSTWPTLVSLKSTTIAEAKLPKPSAVYAWVNGTGVGTVGNKDTYMGGNMVVYRLCTNGGLIYYWDYTKDSTENPKNIAFGNGC